MNERIRELAEQAEKYADDNFRGEPTYSEAYDSKFAELIVGECMNILDPNGEYTKQYKHSHTPGPDGLRTVLSQEHYFEMLASNKIKEHFGVSE